MKNSALIGVEYHLPEHALTNEMLSSIYPEWPIEKIYQKTGIKRRHIAEPHVCASDLVLVAAEKLLESGICSRSDIDFILFCTQSPDYLLPTTACLIQKKLNLSIHIGALDFNQGCSGYIYGLSLAQALIAIGQAKNILLLTADTYSKYIRPDDRVNRTIFGDGASASLIKEVDSKYPLIGPFILGTDGRGAENLIVKNSGSRQLHKGLEYPILSMNGPEIFNFTLDVVPKMITNLCKKACVSPEMIDFYIFHQANLYMLEHLRKKIFIPKNKMLFFIENCGNTVSSTIPIVLHEALKSGQLKSRMKIMLIGFGVGYSWGATIVEIPEFS